LSLLNHLMASVLKKSLPTVGFNQGNLIVQMPTHFLGLVGLDDEFSLGGVVASLLDFLPTFSPILSVIESRSALTNRMINRRDAIAAEFNAQILKSIASGDSSVSALVSRRNPAVAACTHSINRLNAMAASRAALCMFSDASIDLHYVGGVAELDNKLPQIARSSMKT
jgi:hypothetical protein